MTTTKTKKKTLKNGNTTSDYTSSLSPDVRRKSPRGKPIATPFCIPSNDSSDSNQKKRKRNQRNNNESKTTQAQEKDSSQPQKNRPVTRYNGQKKNTATNNTSPKQQKQQKQQPLAKKQKPSTPSTTRITRSQARQEPKQQKNDNDSDTTTKKSTPAKVETLVIPRKHHIKQASTMTTTLLGLEENDILDKNEVECPYCSHVISLKDSKIVAKAYTDIKNKDLAYSGQVPPSHPIYDMETLPTHYKKRQKKRPVPWKEQYTFCQLHKDELEIKPHGIELGWPTIVRFESLKKRVYHFKDELDMVIDGKMDSSYRQMALEAYDEMGQRQARSVFGRMAVFEKTLPGYYGMKGANAIRQELAKMYLHTGKLDNVAHPLTKMDFLLQVLIPEVGYRLIREDMIKRNKNKQNDPDLDEQAKATMSESTSFGSYMQPLGLNDSVSSDEDE